MPPVYVAENPHAPPERAFTAWVADPVLGRVDSAGATEAAAREKVERRWRLRWLGVEPVGLAPHPDQLEPHSGQIAERGYRYALWRHVGDQERCVCFIMLNPSTADAIASDPTITRLRGYAADWGYGWLTVGNLYPFRSPSPKELKQWLGRPSNHAMEKNHRAVMDMATRAEVVVCAWGALGESGAATMLAALRSAGIEPHALKLTKAGHPGHPLHLKKTLKARPWRELLAA